MLRARNPPGLSAAKPPRDLGSESFFESPAGLALFSTNYSTKHIPRAVLQRRAYEQGWLQPTEHKFSTQQKSSKVPQSLGAQAQTKNPIVDPRVESILQELRDTLSRRGARGIFSFLQFCQKNDLDRSGKLTLPRFEKALKDAELEITPEGFTILYENYGFGTNHLVYNELVKAIAGKISSQRREVILALFGHFRKGDDGKIDREEVKRAFHAAGHPDVVNGHKRVEEVTLEFIDTFLYYCPPRISRTQFLDYFAGLSISYSSDTTFSSMVKCCWPILDQTQSTADDRTGTRGFPATPAPKPRKRDGRLVYKRYDVLPDYSVAAIGMREGEQRVRIRRMGRVDRTAGIVLPLELIFKTIKNQLRSTASNRKRLTVASLIRNLRAQDPHQTLCVPAGVFTEVLLECLPLLGVENMDGLIVHYATESNAIPYMRFIEDLRGDMDPLRRYVSDQAFARLDTPKRGFIDIHQLRAAFDCTRFTEWLSGEKSRDRLFEEELEAGFDGSERMDQITKEMFRLYWANRGATIEDDNVFSYMVFTTFQSAHPQLRTLRTSGFQNGAQPNGYLR
ncbi:uncharacterized protein SPPG_03615 [Spizellomyces punctatus DAOM BR117]|uniref:EF-hand domain-containing protein n=1 Tax=Spizellomyces punctatus (strain DAOM BR117) TaxID=645134 RepID=A0A0L0HLP5_SPIPD|nr:uncharacterized protein SPPG_03615 [Spizellomyces punctatus DAOM BR117]KND01825.1 hypothetical protein SPPG_03615 [Spizellomyces punctatus DAOM BR117]|eukprot:XP_016609864.1 hypothetical protein SPPG_03615 [Spizellomyces punctatus DAOM BR117]